MKFALIYQRGKDAGWHFFHRPLGLLLIILYKALWGALEMLIGTVIFFSPTLIARELAEDPQDLFANWFLAHFSSIPTNAFYLGLFVMSLGAIKVMLAVGLWYEAYFVRTIGIVFFLIIGLYACYDVTFHFSPIRLAALFMDAVILFYLWRILPHHFKRGEIA